MKIVTVASDNQRYFPYLVESCRRNECSLIVLGWGEKWQGLSWKIKLMHEFLKQEDDDEIICFVDGYDVVVLQHHDIIINSFQKTVGNRNDIVLFSEDRSSRGLMFNIFNKLFFRECHNTYINSGTYIGYVRKLKEITNEMIKSFKDTSENDQRLVQIMCQKNPNSYLIDKSCNVFLVVCTPGKMISKNEEHITIVNKKLRYKKQIWPCFLHASGYTNMDDILLELGYDNVLYSFNQTESEKYVVDNAIHYSKWFIKYNIVIILIILIISILTCLFIKFF